MPRWALGLAQMNLLLTEVIPEIKRSTSFCVIRYHFNHQISSATLLSDEIAANYINLVATLPSSLSDFYSFGLNCSLILLCLSFTSNCGSVSRYLMGHFAQNGSLQDSFAGDAVERCSFFLGIGWRSEGFQGRKRWLGICSLLRYFFLLLSTFLLHEGEFGYLFLIHLFAYLRDKIRQFWIQIGSCFSGLAGWQKGCKVHKSCLRSW